MSQGRIGLDDHLLRIALFHRDGTIRVPHRHKRNDGSCPNYDLPSRTCKIACPWCDSEEVRQAMR